MDSWRHFHKNVSESSLRYDVSLILCLLHDGRGTTQGWPISQPRTPFAGATKTGARCRQKDAATAVSSSRRLRLLGKLASRFDTFWCLLQLFTHKNYKKRRFQYGKF